MWIKRSVFDTIIRKAAEDQTRVELLTAANESLKRRVKEMIQRLDAERLRSDEAVDQMLRVKGLPSVSPTEKPPTLEQLSDVFSEDPVAVKEIVDEIKNRGAAEVLLDTK